LKRVDTGRTPAAAATGPGAVTAASYLALGKPEMARQLCESQATPLRDDMRRWLLSLTYRALGNLQQAENELTKLRAVAGDSKLLLLLKVDWMLDPIRNEHEFKAILAKMNFPP
jgi:hypothetical protein